MSDDVDKTRLSEKRKPSEAEDSDSRKRSRFSSEPKTEQSTDSGTRPRRRRWDTGAPAAAPTATPTAIASPSPPPTSLGTTPEEIARQAQLIQQQIQEKLKALNLPFAKPAGVAVPSIPVVPSVPSVAPSFSSLSSLSSSAPKRSDESKGWVPLILDEKGRHVDQSGKEVKLQRSVATIKTNIALEKGVDLFTATTPGAGLLQKTEQTVASHIDPRLSLSAPSERKSRKLDFVTPGKYAKRAQAMRMRQLSRDIAANFETTKDEGVSSKLELLEKRSKDPVPNIEWWDKPLLKEESYESEFVDEKITHLISHPVPIQPLNEAPPPPPQPLPLTKQERKKLKRMQKLEKMRYEHDQIRAGLMPAPEPRLSTKNLMRVLGQDAVSDPTLMEAKVQKQVAERKAKHEEHNASRALTPAEKREKKRKKLAANPTKEIHVAVFRAGDLTNGQRRFKVSANASQYQLTGSAVIYRDCNVVVVEGSPKNIKKYIHLMLKRIKWSDQDQNEEDGSGGEDDDEEAARPSNQNKGPCVLAWQGQVPARNFKSFVFENMRTEAMARQYFVDKGLAHYWDMCRFYKDPNSEE